MILTTTNVIQGAVIESYLGVVTAESVYRYSLLDNIQNGVGIAQCQVLEELEQQAQQLSADAVIDIKIKSRFHKQLLLITAIGTAVKIR
ncbi:MAG TPA: heavy metal-binding domain-containing protein [Nostocaceae cyanobacterium]|nr:heavy metal-binding domain-containing protein [Nostocaceae cyanobacterium]